MPPEQRIVIVTDMFDSHADAMMHHLRGLGHEPFRLHTADLTQDAHLTTRVSTSDPTEVVIRARGEELALHEARSIWWRRPGPFVLTHLATEGERTHADAESRHAWLGALSELDCYFVSHPTAIDRARYKLGQLERARRLGLAVPDTLVTNDPSAVREFHAAHGGAVVYKTLSNPFIDVDAALRPDTGDPAAAYTSFTTQVTDSLLADLGDLGRVPSLFQNLVEKDVELRVTVIGDEIFVAEIKSQEHERTSTDWRHHEIQVPWSEGRLPDDVRDACMALTHGYGLNFAAIDLVRRPDGEHVFLEINSNGQWLFVEERVPALRMLDAMAGCLMRGSSG